jgi:hypothetical protein
MIEAPGCCQAVGLAEQMLPTNKCMRIFELAKPKSPEQLRLDQLKASSNRASDALKVERERQKAQRAQKALSQLLKPKSNTIKPIQPIKPR